MIATLYKMDSEHRRQDSEQRCGRKIPVDLAVSTGQFRVSDQGIVARLNPPLSRLSGFYPWQFFPTSLAALKLLVVDLGQATDDGGIAVRLGLSDLELTQLDRKIGRVSWSIGDDGRPVMDHDSPFLDGVDRLLSWSSDVAGMCPYRSVAQDLVRVPTMSVEELNQYVSAWLS